MTLATRIPRAAFWLGLAGLVPFLAGLSPLLWQRIGPHFFLAYAVAILAFMGGVQWGGVMSRAPRQQALGYILSVIPAVLAALAGELHFVWAVPALIFGFLLVLAVDLFWVADGSFPVWYRRLRVFLSPVVVLSLAGWLLLYR